jgi:hypothetical protein
MFKTLDEVKARWHARYAASGIEDDLLISPGYPISDIDGLEQTIGLKFHPSMRKILQEFNLDQVGFHNVHFGSGSDYLPWLRDWGPTAVDTGLLCIGGSDGNVLLLNNASGGIFAIDHEYAWWTLEAPLEQVASNIEEYILIAATLVDHKWPKFKDKTEAIQIGLAFLNENGILQGQHFWCDLIRNAA